MITLLERKQRILTWLKNPYTIVFLAILTIGIIIRLKFLFINGSGLWWDEINWLQSAQIIAGMSPKLFEAAKAPLFAVLGSFFFLIGLGENSIRFFLVFLPSVGIVILTYFLGKEVFNKKVGLIAMAMMCVLSHHLFYQSRVMGDMLANFLELLAIVLFIAFYVNKKKPHLLFIPIAIGIFAFLTRYSASLALIAIAVYLILTERLSLLKNKHFWVATGVTAIMFTIFGLINLSIFGNAWPALTHYILNPVSGTAAVVATHGFINPSFLYSIFDYLNFGGHLLGGGTVLIKSLIPGFLIGLTCFFGVFLGIDKILSKKSIEEIKRFKPVFALFLWLIISAYGWIFIFHYVTPRWGMGIAPAILVITAYGYWVVYGLIKKIINRTSIKRSSQLIATIIVLVLLLFSLTLMYQRTDRMINIKAKSYDYVKPVSFWVQDNVPENELIMFPSWIWYQYYTQRDNFINEQVIKIAAFKHRNLTHLFFEEVQYGLIPVCEYDYEIGMRDTGIDWFVWSVGQQVWSPSPIYMNKLMSDGILTGYASFNSRGAASSWVFKVNKKALNQKINDLNYQNQSYSVMTMEQWGPWNNYKQKVSITEKDICGYIYNEDGGNFYNDNQIERLHRKTIV